MVAKRHLDLRPRNEVTWVPSGDVQAEASTRARSLLINTELIECVTCQSVFGARHQCQSLSWTAVCALPLLRSVLAAPQIIDILS